MDRREIIRQAIEPGRRRGFVTFGQFNELMPATTGVTPEDIEAPLKALNDEGIDVVEDEQGTRPGPCMKTVQA